MGEREVEQQITGISEERIQLNTEAGRLKKEIVELSGEDAAVGGMTDRRMMNVVNEGLFD